jgi:hypothetical protein
MRSHDSTRQLSKLFRTDWNDLLKKLRLENTSARTYSQQLKHLYLSLDEMLQCTSRLEYYIGDSKHRPKKHYNRYRFNSQLIEEERVEFEQQALDYLKKVIKHRQQFHYFQEQQIFFHHNKQNVQCVMNYLVMIDLMFAFFYVDMSFVTNAHYNGKNMKLINDHIVHILNVLFVCLNIYFEINYFLFFFYIKVVVKFQ